MPDLSNPADLYQRESVLTESPARLVVRLYDAALRALDLADEAHGAGDPAAATSRLSKAYAVVSELLCAIDREAGGEVAERLSALYTFLLSRLLVPPYDPGRAAGARRILVSLREGFDAAARQTV